MLHPDFGEPSCLTKDVAVSSLPFLRHSLYIQFTVFIYCSYMLVKTEKKYCLDDSEHDGKCFFVHLSLQLRGTSSS